MVYSLMSSAAPGSIDTWSRSAAPRAMSATDCGDSGSKKISAQRERIAGLISSGRRVVAPMRMKSAGAPSLKSLWIYAGMPSSSSS